MSAAGTNTGRPSTSQAAPASPSVTKINDEEFTQLLEFMGLSWQGHRIRYVPRPECYGSSGARIAHRFSLPSFLFYDQLRF